MVGWSFPRIECMVRSANTVTITAITHRGSVNTYEHIPILLLKTIFGWLRFPFPIFAGQTSTFRGLNPVWKKALPNSWSFCTRPTLEKILKKPQSNINHLQTLQMMVQSCAILLKSPWNHRTYQQLFFVPRYQAQHPFRQQHGIKTVLLQLCQRGICQVLCVLGMENSWKMMG